MRVRVCRAMRSTKRDGRCLRVCIEVCARALRQVVWAWYDLIGFEWFGCHTRTLFELGGCFSKVLDEHHLSRKPDPLRQQASSAIKANMVSHSNTVAQPSRPVTVQLIIVERPSYSSYVALHQATTQLTTEQLAKLALHRQEVSHGPFPIFSLEIGVSGRR